MNTWQKITAYTILGLFIGATQWLKFKFPAMDTSGMELLSTSALGVLTGFHMANKQVQL